jgi:hypothetical protein
MMKGDDTSITGQGTTHPKNDTVRHEVADSVPHVHVTVR